jgi:hypothetical protein
VSNWVRIYVQVVKISLEVSIGEEEGIMVYSQNQVLLVSRFHVFTLPSYVSLCVAVNILTSVVDPDLHGYALVWLSWIRNRIRNADPDPGAWNRPN